MSANDIVSIVVACVVIGMFAGVGIASEALRDRSIEAQGVAAIGIAIGWPLIVAYFVLRVLVRAPRFIARGVRDLLGRHDVPKARVVRR